MFHFPTFPPHALCVQARVTPHDWCGVPPFGNPRINARLTAPRGLSQPPTSFIGSWCQGIHRAPLTTWPHKNTAQHAPGRTPLCGPTRTLLIRVRRCSRPLCSSQRTTRHRSPDPTSPASSTLGCRQRYEMQTGPDTRATSTTTQNHSPVDGSALSGPNSVPTTTQHSRDSGPRPPRSEDLVCSTGSRQQPAAELVSVPPSSTTPEACGPSRVTGHRVLGAALDHQHEVPPAR